MALTLRRRSSRRARSSARSRRRRRELRSLGGVATEDASDRELAELVPDHVLDHVELVEGLAVVHLEVVADELGHHGAAASPRLDGDPVAGLLLTENLLHQLGVDVGTLPERAGHLSSTSRSPDPLLAAADDELGRTRLRLAGQPALREHARRTDRVTTAGPTTLAATHGVVDGVPGRAAAERAIAHPAVTARVPDRDVVVDDVAELADRGAAGEVDLAHLARGQRERR